MNTIQLDCPACAAKASLISESKWSRRTNSRVARAHCAYCGHAFFLKQLIFHEQMPSLPKQEYATLQLVDSHFPGDNHFKVAKPVHYADSSNIIIMEYAEGNAFPAVLQKAEVPRRLELVTRAGAWLSKLHCCRTVTPTEPHTVQGAASRLVELKSAWDGQKHTDDTTALALKLLLTVVKDLDEHTQNRVWVHGDFTPDNLLVCEDAIIGLDVAWHSRANPVMDLAPFLNHLGLANATAFGYGLRKGAAELEAAFLLGYSRDLSIKEMILLYWFRLYFLLCYRLTSLQSGVVPRYISKIQINHQISRLAREFEAILNK